jgi:hypothetical protein
LIQFCAFLAQKGPKDAGRAPEDGCRRGARSTNFGDRVRSLGIIALFACGLAACSSGDGGNSPIARDASHHDAANQDAGVDDASAGFDASAGADAQALDAMIPDASGTDATGVDASSSDAMMTMDASTTGCGANPATDLNQSGTRMGSTTRFVGSNQAATMTPLLPAPSCQPSVASEVLLEYTPSADTRLYVSTDHADTTFETAVWMLDACSSTAQELGCGVANIFGQTATLSARVHNGQTITIVVAGSRDPFGGSTTGTFDLSVTEMTALQSGDPCDLASTMSYCAPPASCIVGAGTSGNCVDDGANGGRCRSGGTACDAMLGCNGSLASASSRCVPLVGSGMPCDPTKGTNVCAPPSACVTSGNMSTCQANTYTESSVPNPSFIDACATGTHVTNLVGRLDPRDDGHPMAGIVIPFAFQFFGTPYDEIWPDTNGYAVLGSAPPTDVYNPPIPVTTEGPTIFAFLEDLTLRPAPGSDMCYVVNGAAPSRQMVIEWLDASLSNVLATQPSLAHLTFEMLLSEGTNQIDFVYQRLDSAPADMSLVNGSQAAIGIQDPSGVRSSVHQGTVSISTGIHFSP